MFPSIAQQCLLLILWMPFYYMHYIRFPLHFFPIFEYNARNYIKAQSCPHEYQTLTTTKDKMNHQFSHKHVIIFNAMINYTCKGIFSSENFSPCDNKVLAWNLCLIRMYSHTQYGHQIILLFWRRLNENVVFFKDIVLISFREWFYKQLII